MAITSPDSASAIAMAHGLRTIKVYPHYLLSPAMRLRQCLMPRFYFDHKAKEMLERDTLAP